MNGSPQLLNDFLSDYSTVLRYMNDYIAEPISQYHMTFDTFLIMHEIGASAQPLLLMDIADRHHVSRSAISRQISILLKYDYVYQVPNPADRRQKSLLLTDHGQQIDTQLIEAIQAMFNHWIDTLGPQRINTMLSLLDDFSRKIIAPAWDAKQAN
ncbi:MarR family winged helix-turn-helix transcriptional regulator [Lactiplantibacillus fabifermentans]|uniref:Transcription regulator n=2 Tax=Lactiplantibacillus fabifermentans TaxID=483011 RepID=A0A0R2NMV7_9LACO|nr:MarR family winged helix-turn-helix transcriptional regulator [Lactiplantibacillus fabifermentans]ETY73426.1 transcriptional regulator [Lactiplantibacillus fabifermentans T30PCM01]KRO27062.1 transcription regulator [Lactiplantibacillus fabifermentans DSM 21115]